MATVGRPRVTTNQGVRAPTREIGVPDLGLGGWGVVGSPSVLQGANGPWRMYVDEWEYVPELRWPLSVRLMDQMRTDSQLAGLITAVMWGICQLRFVIDPNGAKPDLVKEIAQDMNLPILGKDPEPVGRMKARFTHSRFVTQAMLSVVYGHNYFEQVGEIVDGKWRLRKLAPRMPQTLRQINVNDAGELVSIMQWTPIGWNFQQNQPSAGYAMGPEIPVDNLVPFVFQQEGMSWTGRSMMRDCYRDWIIKDRDLRIEAINHERAGGVPWAEGAQGMTDPELQDLNVLMTQFRIGEQSGLAVPFGTKLNIARGTGSDVDKTIKRLDESMARRFLLQLVNLAQGGSHVGSYALSETFEDFFLVGQRHIAQWYCDIMTEHVIEDIVDWNYGEGEEFTPRLTWERASEDALGTDELAKLVHDGVITMDDETENWIRYRKLMPKKLIPRPEITPGGPFQAPINKTNPQEQLSEQPGTGNTSQVPANPQTVPKTRASAGSEARVLPPADDPAPDPDVMAAGAPALVTVPNVEILHAGVEYPLSTGSTTFTPEDLRDAVMAANEDPSIPNPRLKLGHIDPRFNAPEFDATPNFGKATNLRLSENGMAVYADYVGVPRWLGEILPYAFPSRSIEGWWDCQSQAGKKWRFVLSACSLLGVQWPGVTVLEDLPQYYGESIPEGVQISDEVVEAVLVAAQSNQTGGDPLNLFGRRTAASANLDDIRRAFYGEYVSANKDANMWWIQAVLTDPNELVVEDDESGQLYKMSFASDSQGNVAFGEAQPVRIDYIADNAPVDVMKAAATHVAATLADGRKVLASWSDREGSVLPSTASGGAMDPKQIRQRLGLPEDASDEQVRDTLRAFNEAVAEQPGEQPGEPQPAAPTPTPPGEEPQPGAPAPTPEPQPGEAQPQPGAQPGEQPQQIAASALPPGVVAIDSATLAELRETGQAARTLIERSTTTEREGLVAAAISDGRIPPARKDHWLTYLASDPEGGAQVLASLEAGLVPLSERGHGHSVDSMDVSQLEEETVKNWTHSLFPETRAAAPQQGDIAMIRRVSADRSYRRSQV